MQQHQKIVSARKKNGLTQEELADRIHVTVRTIQRIESGKSVPRNFTLKAIAAELNLSFEELTSVSQPADRLAGSDNAVTMFDEDDTTHFLKIFCISCFSYLILPYVHFIIPSYLLKKRKETNAQVLRFARKVIRMQIYWLIATMLVFLFVLLVNFILAVYLKNGSHINYLFPFFIMYFINLVIISGNLRAVYTFNFQNSAN